MKWRQSIIYLVVLLLLGGYFYYFEVVKKEQKEAAEKEAKKVFSFNVDTVKALDIYSKDKQSVQLSKDGHWQIVSPVKTDVDKPVFDDFLRDLSSLESERKITQADQDLKTYGLQDPHLKIRFQTGDKWTELLVGDKTPVGDGRYALIGGEKNVFLLAMGNWSALDKGLNELRRHELFTFRPEDVTGMKISWQDGTNVSIEKQADTWKASQQPDLKIKKSKVDNVLEQVHWLRARSFLQEGSANLEAHGLNPPYVTVDFTIGKDKSSKLELSNNQNQQKQVAALSSELPAVVEVDASVLGDLPKNIASLEDRTLAGVKADTFKGVKWHIGDTAAEVHLVDKNNWELKKGDKAAQPLKESWHVKSLLWDLDDSEYQTKIDPMPQLPAKPFVQIELLDGGKNRVVLSWEKAEAKNGEPQTVWIERSAEKLAVKVKPETLEKIVNDLQRIIEPEQAKKPS